MEPVVPRKIQLALRAATMGDPSDPVPVEIPEALMRQESIEERLQAFIKNQLSAVAKEVGFGSEEEENDFDWPGLELDDDQAELSVYQVQMMQEEYLPPESRAEEARGSEAETEADSSPAEPKATVGEPQEQDVAAAPKPA